jgi:hypothetical protein
MVIMAEDFPVFASSLPNPLGQRMMSPNHLDDLDLDLAADSVDDLLGALEHASDHYENQLLGQEEMMGTEGRKIMENMLEDVHPGRESVNSFSDIEPLKLDEEPNDPNFLFGGLAEDIGFQHNLSKLDTFMEKHADFKSVQEEQELNARDLYPDYFGPSTSEGTGKRRRAQRRSSLPTMHLQYEDPFEPRPVVQTAPMQLDFAEPPSKLIAVQPSAVDESLPSVHRRAQRRGSLPVMHLHYSADNLDYLTEAVDDEFVPEKIGAGRPIHRGSTGSAFGAVASDSLQTMRLHHSADDLDHYEDYDTELAEDKRKPLFVPHKLPGGRARRRGSTGAVMSDKIKKFEFSSSDDEGESSYSMSGNTRIPDSLNPIKMMERLRAMMEKSTKTQKALQQWDKDNGLPKSHSQTMVNTSRSRQQLQDGKILPKWDGTPLINEETELGRPKPRTKGKMKRRGSAPTSSCESFY